MEPHPICLFIRQRNAFSERCQVSSIETAEKPWHSQAHPSVFAGEGTLGGCGACWCVQVISRRHNQDRGWGEHFFNSKWFKPLASEDRGRLPLRKPLLKRELNMSELWISYDFKDAQILNTSGVSACPDVLQNSQKPEIVFHHFSFVMVKVLVLPFAFLFLCVYKDCLFFLFRPCQHVSRALLTVSLTVSVILTPCFWGY